MKHENLLNKLVRVPAPLYAPTVYTKKGKARKTRIGRVVEVHPNLVAVKFYGYRNAVDYSAREVAIFEIIEKKR